MQHVYRMFIHRTFKMTDADIKCSAEGPAARIVSTRLPNVKPLRSVFLDERPPEVPLTLKDFPVTPRRSTSPLPRRGHKQYHISRQKLPGVRLLGRGKHISHLFALTRNHGGYGVVYIS